MTKQLRCFGLLENTQMQKKLYSVRYDYVDFVSRYQAFLPKSVVSSDKIDCVKATQHICATTFGSENINYKFGDTKIFLKAEHETLLQKVKKFYNDYFDFKILGITYHINILCKCYKKINSWLDSTS